MTIVPLSEENVQLFSQTAAKILPEAWSFETYKKQLSNPDDISFLALCNGEAAGFISVWCVCGEAEINNIGVLEKFRRMGIAKALFDSAYNAAKAEKWYLEVRESNLGAISFYEKLGFERVGMTNTALVLTPFCLRIFHQDGTRISAQTFAQGAA